MSNKKILELILKTSEMARYKISIWMNFSFQKDK